MLNPVIAQDIQVATEITRFSGSSKSTFRAPMVRNGPEMGSNEIRATKLNMFLVDLSDVSSNLKEVMLVNKELEALGNKRWVVKEASIISDFLKDLRLTKHFRVERSIQSFGERLISL